jgi:hypothetical protein
MHKENSPYQVSKQCVKLKKEYRKLFCLCRGCCVVATVNMGMDRKGPVPFYRSICVEELRGTTTALVTRATSKP